MNRFQLLRYFDMSLRGGLHSTGMTVQKKQSLVIDIIRRYNPSCL
jgi:hypothetical protein